MQEQAAEKTYATTLEWRISLAKMLPDYFRRILFVGSQRLEAIRLIQQRHEAEFYILETDPVRAEALSMFGDAVVSYAPYSAPPPFPRNYFDAALLSDPAIFASDSNTLQHIDDCLSEFGQIVLLLPNAQYAGAVRPDLPSLDDVTQAAMRKGWLLYANRNAEDERIVPTTPASPETQRAAVLEFMLLFVRQDYNPLLHARNHLDAGRPDCSFRVLESIPEVYMRNPETLVTLVVEMHLSVLAWLIKEGGRNLLFFLTRSLESFNQLTSTQPLMHLPYQCQAQVWRIAGRTDLAARLLDTIQHASPDDAIARQRAALGAIAAPPREEPPPEWTPAPDSFRILYVIHPRVHYGLDVLYDGLCSVLGDANVVDYPRKPSLHGGEPSSHKNYPCMFDRAGAPMPLDAVLDALRAGHFHAVLFGDCEDGVNRGETQQILDAAGNTPVFLLDQLDECMDLRGLLAERFRKPQFAGYFKREMVAGVEYGPGVFPLPFGFPDGRVLDAVQMPKTRACFWAGHRRSGLRRLYVEALEEMLGSSLSEGYPPDEYYAKIREAQVGLSLFGFGYDTVRYWELPANGCLLFSERLPIRIPHDFTDGENAVLFETLPELKEKLRHYLDRPERCAEIAVAGLEYVRRHHTGSARARQLLGWMRQQIG